MAVFGGMVMGILVVIGALLLLLALQAGLLRLVAGWVAGAKLSWLAALGTTVVAGCVQMCASGILGGADGGLIGAVVGLLVWSGAVAAINGIPLSKAALIGVVLAIVQWFITWALVIMGIAALIGGLVGVAALG